MQKQSNFPPNLCQTWEGTGRNILVVEPHRLMNPRNHPTMTTSPSLQQKKNVCSQKMMHSTFCSWRHWGEASKSIQDFGYNRIKKKDFIEWMLITIKRFASFSEMRLVAVEPASHAPVYGGWPVRVQNGFGVATSLSSRYQPVRYVFYKRRRKLRSNRFLVYIHAKTISCSWSIEMLHTWSI